MIPILFKLENCIKCELAEKYLENTEHRSIELSKNIHLWGDEHKSLARKYDVIFDLSITAPVLVTDDGKFIGVLAIKKWLGD